MSTTVKHSNLIPPPFYLTVGGGGNALESRMKNHCSEEQCDREVVARGLCDHHYKIWKKFGRDNANVRCAICQRPYFVNPARLNIGMGKVCSKKCLGVRYAAERAGRTLTAEHRAKISDGLRGHVVSDVVAANMSEAAYRRLRIEGWTGEKSKYGPLHTWVRRNFGTPAKCEHCSTTSAPLFDWANVSGQYLRARSDWVRLCRRCHIKFDKANPKRPELLFHEEI
jgi:hypothetical protein